MSAEDMHWIWSASLILLWADAINGISTPLQCYECSKCEACSKAPLASCFSDQDVCAIIASWDGNPYNPMGIAKRCESANHCAPGATSTVNTTYCDTTTTGIRCMTCCTGNGCNDGAIGDFPRPPPLPPIPEYKVDQCAGSAPECETSATVEGDTVNVRKYCGKSTTGTSQTVEPASDVDQCNIQDDNDICVTCCDKDCYKSNDSWRTLPDTFLNILLGLLSRLLIIGLCRYPN